MLASFGRGLYRTRWGVLIVAMIAVVGAALYGFGVFGALKSGGFQDPQAQSTAAQNLFLSQLKASSTDAVVLLQDDQATVTQPDFQNSAQTMITQLQARPEVAAVTSYYSTHSASFISTDGHETFLLLRLTGPNKDSQWATLRPLITSANLHVTFGGNLDEGPLVLPGHYTVKLSVDGKDYTANFTVQPDPRLPADATRMAENLKWTLKIRDDLTRLANAINQLKGVKAQLVSKKELLKDHEHESLTKAIQELIDKLDALEAKMHNSKAEITYDLLAQKGGAKLYSALAEVYGTIMDTDAPPTQGVREVYDDCMKELQGYETELKDLLGPQLAKINDMAKDIPFVTVPKVPHSEKKAETGTSGKK